MALFLCGVLLVQPKGVRYIPWVYWLTVVLIGMKPRSASDWHLIDKGIDETLTALGASSHQKVDCKKALENLRGIFAKLDMKP
jgi:uncharacterized membrane-anchored protein